MGKCIYCGENAGFFKNKHPECEQIHNINVNTKKAVAEIERIGKNAVAEIENMGKCPVLPLQSNNAVAADKKRAQNTDDLDLVWDTYHECLKRKHEVIHEKLPISKEKLIAKLYVELEMEEIELFNEVHSVDIDDFILSSSQPYSFLVRSLKRLTELEHLELCKKLFPVIEEYRQICKDVYFNHIFWERKIDVYWKLKGDTECYKNAMIYSHSLIGIAGNVSEFLKNAFGYETLREHIGYKRMLMILEKENDFERIIKLCEKAKSEGWKGTWDDRIAKAKAKLQKQAFDKPLTNRAKPKNQPSYGEHLAEQVAQYMWEENNEADNVK